MRSKINNYNTARLLKMIVRTSQMRVDLFGSQTF